jgi:hypothetical protein
LVTRSWNRQCATWASRSMTPWRFQNRLKSDRQAAQAVRELIVGKLVGRPTVAEPNIGRQLPDVSTYSRSRPQAAIHSPQMAVCSVPSCGHSDCIGQRRHKLSLWLKSELIQRTEQVATSTIHNTRLLLRGRDIRVPLQFLT